MRGVSLLAGLLALTACKGDEPAKAPAKVPASATAPSAPPADAEGQRIVGALKQRLLARLTEAMKGGPAAAIEVCNTEAPAIAASLAQGGVTIGRATRRPRNPANLAAGWQAEALAHFEQLRQGGGSLDGATWTRSLPEGRTAYAEPLVIKELCVVCHGAADALAPEVKASLAARYPADQATGYAPGDLRGVAWVELPPPSTR